MEGKRKTSSTLLLSKEQESDLIESYLDNPHPHHHHQQCNPAKSNNSKKSKFTSRSKLTKSSLFRTIFRREDSELSASKDHEVQLYLLQGSVDTLVLNQESYLHKFEGMAGEYLSKLDNWLGS